MERNYLTILELFVLIKVDKQFQHRKVYNEYNLKPQNYKKTL